MSYAVMPLIDYKAACDKVREKVDLTTVKFEETDFGYLRSEIFTVPKDGKYIFSCEFSNPINLSYLYYANPQWQADMSPGSFEIIDSNNVKTIDNLYTTSQYRIFIDGITGITPKDILKASLSIDGETVVDFVTTATIKSGELADKVDKVYWTAANNFGLKGKGQGELVHFDNVHPIEHKVEVGLSSKNLFNEGAANITKTEDYFSSNIHYTQGSFFELAVQPNETYTVSYLCSTPNEGVWGTQVLLGVCKTPTWVGASVIARTLIQERHYLNFSADTLTFKVPADTYTVYFQATTALQFKNFQIEKGNSPTAYTPYTTDFTNYKIKVTGKNLLDMNSYAIWTDSGLGFKLENLIEGQTYAFSTNIPIKQMKVSNAPWGYTCNGGKNVDSGFIENKWVHKRAEQLSPTTPLYLFIIPVGETSFIKDITAFDGYQLQIEAGNKETEYEPYNESSAEYTAAADGTVEGVKSISPVMNLATNKTGAVINAECFLDPQVVITDLTNTVITLGGEI